MQSARATLLCQHHYDALDRLIANVLQCKPLHKRFYCKSRLATEIQGANRYSMFQHGDQLLAQQQSEGDAPDATLLATDQQRSVLHTLKANHPRQPIAYTPYGHHRPGNGLLSLFCFNGERPDPVTGHYLLGNGYRAFNPVLMRFNSPDSWSPFGRGGLNSYAYCLGDPANHLDPGGHVTFKTAGKLIMTTNSMIKNTRAKQIDQDWSKDLRLKTTETVDGITIKHYRDNIKTIEKQPSPLPPSPPSLEELAFRKAESVPVGPLKRPPNYRPRFETLPDLSEDVNFINYAYNTHQRAKAIEGPYYNWQYLSGIISSQATQGRIFGVRRSSANRLSTQYLEPNPRDIDDYIFELRRNL